MKLTSAQIQTIAKEYPEEVQAAILVEESRAVEVRSALPGDPVTILTVHADGTVIHRTPA